MEALRGSELILRAGDVGRPEILDELRRIAPVVAVRGNVDHGLWAQALPVSRTVPSLAGVRVNALAGWLMLPYLLWNGRMIEVKDNSTVDPWELSRFTKAQAGIYDQVLTELRAGRKRSHWMWFIFPQLAGLGSSSTARHYAIRSLAEGRQYLNHPVLGARLRECAEAVLRIADRSASEIFGYPDDLKLHSSITLFVLVAEPRSVFVQVLEKYFDGEQDSRTLELLKNLGNLKFRSVRRTAR